MTRLHVWYDRLGPTARFATMLALVGLPLAAYGVANTLHAYWVAVALLAWVLAVGASRAHYIETRRRR